jgi:hypothetical protein
MKQITKEQVRAVRAELLPPGSIATVQDCLAAVERLGFVWPFTPGTEWLPAIFPAMAADSEGQKWDMMWGWKDHIAASRQAYYGKVVAGKPTFVSHEWLAVFYALTGNTGDLEDDLEHAAETMRLNEQAPKVCQYLQEYGPTGTRTLIAKLTDGTREMKKGLEKAIEQLDSLMLITKSGTEGGNSIANIWDLFPRFHAEAVDAGTALPTRQAAVKLFEQFFVVTPAISERDLAKLFPWNTAHQERALAKLKETGYIEPCLLEGKPALKLTAWQ